MMLWERSQKQFRLHVGRIVLWEIAPGFGVYSLNFCYSTYFLAFYYYYFLHKVSPLNSLSHCLLISKVQLSFSSCILFVRWHVVTYVKTCKVPGSELYPFLGSYLGGEMRQEAYYIPWVRFYTLMGHGTAAKGSLELILPSLDK